MTQGEFPIADYLTFPKDFDATTILTAFDAAGQPIGFGDVEPTGLPELVIPRDGTRVLGEEAILAHIATQTNA